MESHPLTTSTTAVVTENALSTTIDGETVILHRDAGKYYGLNEVGTFIWELLQEPHSVEDLCQAVVDEYNVDRERCQTDVESILEDLADNDLIRLEES